MNSRLKGGIVLVEVRHRAVDIRLAGVARLAYRHEIVDVFAQHRFPGLQIRPVQAACFPKEKKRGRAVTGIRDLKKRAGYFTMHSDIVQSRTHLRLDDKNFSLTCNLTSPASLSYRPSTSSTAHRPC